MNSKKYGRTGTGVSAVGMLEAGRWGGASCGVRERREQETYESQGELAKDNAFVFVGWLKMPRNEHMRHERSERRRPRLPVTHVRKIEENWATIT